MKILLVEDDESIVALLSTILNEQNYVLDIAFDGTTGWDMVGFSSYDLIILDIGLPKLDGLSFCQRLRAIGNQSPVLLLTARDAESERVLGLDSGADDYVIKPFNIQELAARIRALLRRGTTVSLSSLMCGNLCLDPGMRKVTYGDHVIPFSRKEYLIIELFLRNQKYVFSRDAIVDRLWSIGKDPPSEDTIKTHIKNIRRKLKNVDAEDLIETLYGQGYRINPKYFNEATPTVVAAEFDSTPSDSTPSQEEEILAQAALEIWERTKEMSFERINVLKQTVQLLQINSLDHVSLTQAMQAAHKLAGSLGTFGFEDGSRLARKIEHQLQKTNQLHQSDDSQNKHLQKITELQLFSKDLQHDLLQQIESLVVALCDAVLQNNDLSLLSDMTSSSTKANNPIADEQTALANPIDNIANAAGSTSGTSDRLSLLVVDCDRDLAETLASEAQAHNFRTTIATTLDAVETAIQSTVPDIILVDPDCIKVSGEDELVADLAQKLPHVPIVVFSDRQEVCDRIATIHAHNCLFLLKSVDPAQVVQTLSRFLQKTRQIIGKILAVDDDCQILAILKSILEPQGFQVTGLEDPTQFWKTLNAVQPNFLILDINMNLIDGIELCRSVRHNLQWNWLPILFLTAQTDRETLEQAFAVGGDDYVAKPINEIELYERLLNRWQRMNLLQNRVVQ